MTNYINIDEYILDAEPNDQILLSQMRNIIQQAAPEATECINYGMPAFKTTKVLVYFAAFKNHIGFYPTGAGIEHFKSELSNYQYSKGAIRFAKTTPLPTDLVQRIVKYRLSEAK